MRHFTECKDWHNSTYWKEQRQCVKKRYKNKCCICGSVSSAAVVDHILPFDSYEGKRKVKLFSSSLNLWCLCSECHGRKTRACDPWIVKEFQNIRDVPEAKKRIIKKLSSL